LVPWYTLLTIGDFEGLIVTSKESAAVINLLVDLGDVAASRESGAKPSFGDCSFRNPRNPTCQSIGSVMVYPTGIFWAMLLSIGFGIFGEEQKVLAKKRN
jgi:hypothetical protein